MKLINSKKGVIEEFGIISIIFLLMFFVLLMMAVFVDEHHSFLKHNNSEIKHKSYLHNDQINNACANQNQKQCEKKCFNE